MCSNSEPEPGPEAGPEPGPQSESESGSESGSAVFRGLKQARECSRTVGFASRWTHGSIGLQQIGWPLDNNRLLIAY